MATTSPLLGRDRLGSQPPTVGVVHLGIGAFHRAHQAVYTELADRDRQWGIAGFTGRTPGAAEALAAQGGVYTLVKRSADGDDDSVIGSLVHAVDGADVARLADLVAAPSTALVTMTVTEDGYLPPDSERVTDAQTVRDLGRLATPLSRNGDAPPLETVAARLAFALDARRRLDGGPVAVVSCDNLADNGGRAASTVARYAEAIDPGLAAWISDNVSFVRTSVDRITPRATEKDIDELSRRRGYLDRCPVIAEPFTQWILSGAFPAGRPAWEEAGALFVENVEPYEHRKLWLLNGAHSLLAYVGRLRGHRTVAEAFDDDACRRSVESLWDCAERALGEHPTGTKQYRSLLADRFGNRRIHHLLDQIAGAGVAKLPARIVPLVERSTGALARRAPLGVLAAWMEYLMAYGPAAEATPSTRQAIALALRHTGREQTRRLLGLVAPSGAEDAELVDQVHAQRSAPAFGI